MSHEIHLCLLLRGAGMHEGSWRHPSADPGSVWSPSHYLRMAQVAERAKFDAVFITDELTSPAGRGGDDAAGRLEPISLLSYVAAGTDHIGLVATASTSFTEPYNLARLLATLDFVSRGRCGWNIVTSASDQAAQNFGRDAIEEHDLRYEKAAEFVDLVRRLWDSWGAEAVVADVESGRYADLGKIAPVDFVGRFFSSRGPLNIPRMPQGRPSLFQAGSSPAGIELASAVADAVFTVQQTVEQGRAFVDRMREAAAGHGRRPDEVKVLPGVVPYVGSTEAEARALKDELDNLVDVASSTEELSGMLGADLRNVDPDGPLPDLVGSRNDARAKAVRRMGQQEGMTLRRLSALAGGGRGHRIVVGTPAQVAADLEEWVAAGAADGFMIAPPVLPAGLEGFVEGVIPELQRRGCFRREYAGALLSDHLGRRS